MESPTDLAKRAAARAAVDEVVRGQALGLGTGSTAAFAVRELAHRFPDGGAFRCVASSRATAELARDLGLHVEELAFGDELDLMLDGADEVSPALDLTKGGGGALFREKLLARRARSVLILVDPTKLVEKLGSRRPIPIEVVPFARPVVLEALARMGLPAALRTVPGSSTPFRSDNQLEILDLRPPVPLDDPGRLDLALRAIPGVLDTGLFIGLATRVFIGHPDGSVETRSRR